MLKIILGLLIATSVFADGKILVEGEHKFNKTDYHPNVGAIGLATYNGYKKLGLISYIGGGMQDRIATAGKQDCYMAVKQDVKIGVSKDLSLTVGGTIKYLTDGYKMNNDVHAVLAYKIWD